MALPTITWEEGLGAQHDAALARTTVETLVERLRAPESSERRVYVVVPTPAPGTREQGQWIAKAVQHGLAAESLSMLTLPRGGCCFVVEDRTVIERWLPVVFRNGPPELTLLALNTADKVDTELVQAVLQERAQLNAADSAGLHFDSGDLVKRF